jgi:hypothetical protein
MDMAVNQNNGNLLWLESELAWRGRRGNVRFPPINLLMASSNKRVNVKKVWPVGADGENCRQTSAALNNAN